MKHPPFVPGKYHQNVQKSSLPGPISPHVVLHVAFHVVNVQLTGFVKLGTPPDHLEERGSNPWRRIPSWTLWHGDGWKAAKNPKLDSRILKCYWKHSTTGDAMMIFFWIQKNEVLVTDIGTTWSFVLASQYWGRLDFNHLTFHLNLRSSLGNRQRCQCLSDFALGVGIMYILQLEPFSETFINAPAQIPEPTKSTDQSLSQDSLFLGKLSANWYNMPLFLWHMHWPRGQIRCPVTSSRQFTGWILFVSDVCDVRHVRHESFMTPVKLVFIRWSTGWIITSEGTKRFIRMIQKKSEPIKKPKIRASELCCAAHWNDIWYLMILSHTKPCAFRGHKSLWLKKTATQLILAAPCGWFWGVNWKDKRMETVETVS